MTIRVSAKIFTLRLCLTALFMGMTIALSSFGIPVPGGHLYLCDVVIVASSLLLAPGEAFIASGIGSFLGDMLFYPPPMFVSLAVHGLQAVVISVFSRHVLKSHPKAASLLGVALGAVIMVVGYTLGKIYVYSTYEYAMVKLPYEIAQSLLGAVLGSLIVFRFGIKKRFDRLIAGH